MRDILKRLSKMVVGYGAIQWAGPLLSFLLFPIITRILDVGDYGTADVILTFASGMGTLAAFAQPHAIATHFNDRPDVDWKRRIAGSALLITLVTGLIMGAALIALAPFITQANFEQQQHTLLLQLVGATIVFGGCGSVLPALAMAGLRVRWGMALSITTILTNTLGNLFFIVVLRVGLAGLVFTPILNSVMLTLVGLFLLRHQIGKPSAQTVRLLFITGLTLLPTLTANWALQVSDRLFLVNLLTQDVAVSMGHYAAANRIASLLGVAMIPLYTAWAPLAIAMSDKPNAKQYYATMSRYLIAVVLVAALGLGLFATELLLILARREYLPAAPYVGFLAYMHVFGAFGVVLSTGALAGKQLKPMSAAVIIGAGVNILLNLVLIPIYGVWGATISTIFSYAVPQVLLYIWLRTRYPVPYPVARLLAALAVQCALLVIGVILPPLAFPLRIGIKIVLFASLPLVLIGFGVITRFEVTQAWLFVRKLWHGVSGVARV